MNIINIHGNHRKENNMGRYKKSESDDMVNAWFSNMADFIKVSRRLLYAKSEMEFEVFLEKAISIDKRSSCLFLRKHRPEIPLSYWKIAQQHLPTFL